MNKSILNLYKTYDIKFMQLRRGEVGGISNFPYSLPPEVLGHFIYKNVKNG